MDSKDLLRIGLIILTGIVLMYLVNTYSSKKSSSEEGFTEVQSDPFTNEIEKFTNNRVAPAVSPGEAIGKNEVYGSSTTHNTPETGEFDLSGNQYPKDCFPKDQLTPAELLPGDANSKWAQVNPAGQGELGDQNFLDAGYHVGVNTVGQTLRNANLQLRSEPPNPQVKVSPWLQSTIEPDTNRKPMEIGGCE